MANAAILVVDHEPQIKQLRRKIEMDPRHPRYILTEPWTGYRLEIPEAAAKKSRRKTWTPLARMSFLLVRMTSP